MWKISYTEHQINLQTYRFETARHVERFEVYYLAIKRFNALKDSHLLISNLNIHHYNESEGSNAISLQKGLRKV